MTDDELETIRERLGRHVHHVTPDHEAALALLAEVDRLREESLALRAAESFLRDDVRCLRAEVDRLRREAVRYRAAVSEHLHRRMQDVLGEYDAAQGHRREAAEEMRRRAVEVLDAEHEYDAAALVEALPTSTEAPDGG